MDKSGHLVTVPRDYLEELEKIYSEVNRENYNAKISYARPNYIEKEIVLLQLDDADVYRLIGSARLVVLDSEGKERHVFNNYL